LNQQLGGDAINGSDLAELIERALDEQTLALLRNAVNRCLDGQEMIERGLGRALRPHWDKWLSDLAADPALRRHFLTFLMSMDDTTLPLDRAAIGPRMVVQCMVPATVLALALAYCGPDRIGPLRPSQNSPGNLHSQKIKGHCVGLVWHNGKPVQHFLDECDDFAFWKSELVMLSGYQAPFSMEELRQRSFGHDPGSVRMDNPAPFRPITLTYDFAFAKALMKGEAAVKSYLGEKWQAWDERPVAYLDNLGKGATP
jgi:hypothetical protein